MCRLAVLRTEPAPPKSLYVLNASDTAVTLLWTEEGVVDFYQIVCRPLGVNRESKVRATDQHHNNTCVRTSGDTLLQIKVLHDALEEPFLFKGDLLCPFLQDVK